MIKKNKSIILFKRTNVVQRQIIKAFEKILHQYLYLELRLLH